MKCIPIGSRQGVGAVFGFKVPSIVVRIAKARNFWIGMAVKSVDGTGT